MGKSKTKHSDKQEVKVQQKQKVKKIAKPEKRAKLEQKKFFTENPENSQKRKKTAGTEHSRKKQKTDLGIKYEQSSSDSDSENENYIDKFFDSPNPGSSEKEDDASSLRSESDVNCDSDALSDDCLVDTNYKFEKIKKISKKINQSWIEESLEEEEENTASGQTVKSEKSTKTPYSNGLADKIKLSKKDSKISAKKSNEPEAGPSKVEKQQNTVKSKASKESIKQTIKSEPVENGSISKKRLSSGAIKTAVDGLMINGLADGTKSSKKNSKKSNETVENGFEEVEREPGPSKVTKKESSVKSKISKESKKQTIKSESVGNGFVPKEKRDLGTFKDQEKDALKDENTKYTEVPSTHTEAQSSNNLVKAYHQEASESDDEDYSGSEESESWTDYDSEEDQEEFETDTDYSMEDYYESEDHSDDCYGSESEDYSDGYDFHEEDCESVPSDEYGYDGYSSASGDYDYIPEFNTYVPDKIIKQGEAIIYDAESDTEVNFNDSTEIIEITQKPVAHDDNSNDSCPELIPLEEAEQTISDNVTLESEKSLHVEDDEELPESGDISRSAIFYDCKDQNSVILKLSSTIFFNGILTVKPILNNIEINGYNFQNQESITTSSISRCDYYLNLTPVVIEKIDEKVAKKFAEDFLKNRLSDFEIEMVINSFDFKRDVLLFLEPALQNSAVQMLQKYSSQSILPFKTQILKKSIFPSSELILNTKFFANPAKQNGFWIENPHWVNLQFTEFSKIMVVGGKNVGKSVLSQYIVNKHIKRFGKVLLVDIDIGQPICSLPQTVSAVLIEGRGLLGRGCLNDHVKNPPDKCVLYGDKSIMISPFKYVRCVKELLKFCEENVEYQKVPWVINTMGYHKGFGLQLMCLLIKIIQPTDLVQIQHSIKSFNFSDIITEHLVNRFELKMFDGPIMDGIEKECFFTTHTIDSVVHSHRNDAKWISNATDKRKIMMLAHLSRVLTGNNTSLNDVRPFCASLDKISVAVMDENCISKDMNLDILNGNVVYLCRKLRENQEKPEESLLECFGIGIVRAIDRLNQNIYLLLPRDDENFIQKINVLAVCNFPVPSAILMKQNKSLEDQNIPYVSGIKNRYLSAKLLSKKSIKDLF